MLCVLISIASSRPFSDYTQLNIISIEQENHSNLKYDNVCSYGLSSLGLKNKFEIALINKPWVFESLKSYCTWSKDIRECYIIKSLNMKWIIWMVFSCPSNTNSALVIWPNGEIQEMIVK